MVEQTNAGLCETGEIATGIFVAAGHNIARPMLACLTSEETHEQICDPAFDTGHVRDSAGGGSGGRSSQGRNEQQQANQEA
jgi:tetrahydromethanopterin S-methyltransferase subunit C